MIRFFFKEAFRIFSRSPFATIVVISITTIAILLMSFSLSLLFISQRLSDNLKNNIEIVVFLNEPLIENSVENIKQSLESKTSVAAVKFVSKEDALKDFKRETGEDFSSVLEENPLPQSFVVRFKPEKISSENFETEVASIKSIPGVAEVLYENEFVVKILRYIKSGYLIVYAVSILLVLLSIYLVYVFSKIQFAANENLYKTMKLVGAKLRTLKIPILIYGVLIGIISGLLSIFIDYSIFYLLSTMFRSIKMPVNINLFYSVLISLGIVLGFLGSYLSARSISLRISEK